MKIVLEFDSTNDPHEEQEARVAMQFKDMYFALSDLVYEVGRKMYHHPYEREDYYFVRQVKGDPVTGELHEYPFDKLSAKTKKQLEKQIKDYKELLGDDAGELTEIRKGTKPRKLTESELGAVEMMRRQILDKVNEHGIDLTILE